MDDGGEGVASDGVIEAREVTSRLIRIQAVFLRKCRAREWIQEGFRRVQPVFDGMQLNQRGMDLFR